MSTSAKPDCGRINRTRLMMRNRQMSELLMMVAEAIGTIATEETIDAYGMIVRIEELVAIEKSVKGEGQRCSTA